MKSADLTILEMLNHAIQSHPQLAPQFESICAMAQGKGCGTATVEQEVKVAMELLGVTAQLAIDVGGNVGNYAGELKRINPSMEVHIFEPASVNLANLRARFSSYPDVYIQASALSNAAGVTSLHSDVAGSGMGSLTKRRLDHFGIDFKVEESISIIRFQDYWATDLQGKVIDLAKLDIEGHELSALQGFGEAIHSTKVIQFEFGGANIDTRTYFQDFWYFFKDYGFDLYRISPFGPQAIPNYKESDEFFSTTNYLAVNKNLRAI